MVSKVSSAISILAASILILSTFSYVRTSTLQSDLSNTEARVAKAEKDNLNLKNQVSELEKSKAELSNKVQALSNDLNNKTQTILKLQADKQSIETQIASLIADSQRLEKEKSDLQRQANDLNAKVAGLDKDKADLSSRLTALANNATMQVNALNNQISLLQQTIASLQTDRANLQNRVQLLLQQIQNLNAAIADLRVQIKGNKTTANNGQLGPWNRTISYPVLFATAISCVASGEYIYCIGGYNGTGAYPIGSKEVGRGPLNLTYYARLSSTGVGPWMRTTDYPRVIQGHSCVVSSNYIYCVGGWGNSTRIVDVYYASLSPSGIGPWTRTTPYPYPVSDPHCMTDSSYIYCVSAHYNGTWVNDFYYAQSSASGVGSWTALPPPPSSFFPAGCSASGGYAYCFGGAPCDPGMALADRCSSPSYYTPLPPNSTRGWNRTADLPTSTTAAYLIADSYVYYFHGGTRFTGQPPVLYFAHLASNGIGSWTKTTAPPPLAAASSPAACVASDGYMYCIGGADFQCTFVGPICLDPRWVYNSVYFTRIGS
jgi:peptidoglycan hydrolase CwlO-like protein